VVVGKELEIRRCSPSHLYSSAFVVEKIGPPSGAPERFVLRGAGWGHGVGFCQIGAAAMAFRGFRAEEILARYFPGTSLTRVYD
jgi:SpoIID/LytB domain protein